MQMLKGYKTYSAAAKVLGYAVGIAAAQVLGYTVPEWALTLLGAFGLYGVRSAIANVDPFKLR